MRSIIVTDTARVALESMPDHILFELARASRVAATEGRTLTISLQNLVSLVAPYL